MPEILFRLQDACLQVSGVVLLLPGIILCIVGLFMWLGGMRYAGYVIAFIGAIFGGLLGLVVGKVMQINTLGTAAVGMVFLGLLARFLKGPIVFLLAVLIFSAFFGTFFLGFKFDSQAIHEILNQQTSYGEESGKPSRTFTPPPLAAEEESSTDGLDYWQRLAKQRAEKQDDSATSTDEQKKQPAPQPEDPAYRTERDPDAALQGLDRLRGLWSDVKNTAFAQRNGLAMWLILGGAVGLVIAILLKNTLMVLCCSIVGTTSVILGVMLLALAKGIPIVTILDGRPKILPAIFIGMLFFGALVQPILARSPKKADKEKKKE